jgi:hypothetical protein
MRAFFVIGLALSGCNFFGPPAPAACSRSGDCGDNERCRAGACEAVVPDCERDGDCNDDEFCEDGECVECIDDRDCTGTDVCEDNECVPGGEEGEGEAPPPPPPPDPDAPRILSISANQTTLTDSDTVIISVVVTDPQGIDDVIGGTLLDPTNDAAFGTFATSAAEGAYQIELTWSAINTVRSITFLAPQQRTLRARFFDVSGNESFSDLTVTLTCGVEPACDGQCAALDCDGTCETSLRGFDGFGTCGACGVTCGDAGLCEGGTPQLGFGAQCQCPVEAGLVAECGGACINLGSNDNCGACGRQCGLRGCAFNPDYQSYSCACNTNEDCDATSICDAGEDTCLAVSNLRLDASNRAVMTVEGATKYLCTVSTEVGSRLCAGVAATTTEEAVTRNSEEFIEGLSCPAGFTSVTECQANNTFLFGCANAQVVICGDEPPPPPPPPAGNIRQSNGFLEVDVGSGSGFGPVCDDDFETADAIVACRQLGTPDSSPTVTSAQANTDVFAMDNLGCIGNETTLLACSYVFVDDCNAGEGLFVTCN